MLKVLGILNCDQVKKSQKWLKNNKIEFKFHNYKKKGITRKHLSNWCETINWELLLNKRSRTWKELSEIDKSNLTQIKAISLMQQYPTLIKRPVIQNGKSIEVGFDSKIFFKNNK